MHPRSLMKTLLLVILVVSYGIGYGQSDDGKKAKEKEQETYEKQKDLKASIKKNQSPEDVVLIMGDPEEVEILQKGKDVVEVWYYDGRDVRIEFENNKTSNWFVRFMPDKPPKEQQKPPKESKEKCNLCDATEKTK